MRSFRLGGLLFFSVPAADLGSAVDWHFVRRSESILGEETSARYVSGLPDDVDVCGLGPQSLWRQRHLGPSHAERFLVVFE